MTDLEKRLQEHAKIAKSNIEAPFNIESEELYMTNKKYKIGTYLLIAAIICIIGTTGFAAVHFLSPKQLAEEIGDYTLAQYFDDNGFMSETKTDGRYKATILGVTNGQRISEFKSSAWELYPDRTYVAVAVEKSDGTPMSYDDEILVTPLIEGLAPWQYNIVTMHGGYSAQLIDGVLYRIIECDSIEYFADKKLYLAVTDRKFLNNQPFAFDQTTGVISVNDNYDGTNILFDLELDKSKANPQKAAEYIEMLDSENIDEDSSEDIETEEIEEYIIGEDLKVTKKEN